eukprot:4857972-Prymnesium_polylepis.1
MGAHVIENAKLAHNLLHLGLDRTGRRGGGAMGRRGDSDMAYTARPPPVLGFVLSHEPWFVPRVPRSQTHCHLSCQNAEADW